MASVENECHFCHHHGLRSFPLIRVVLGYVCSSMLQNEAIFIDTNSEGVGDGGMWR